MLNAMVLYLAKNKYFVAGITKVGINDE